MTNKREKILAAFMAALLLACLLPVMYLGRYNHATGDDYYYGVPAKLEWENSGSLIKTVAEAAKGVVHEYSCWQGTYSAMLLMHLPPNIFGEEAYQLVTAAILILLTGSIFYLLKPILCGWLSGSAALWFTVSAGISLLCIETVPSQGETFFWYNGSMYYTGYFAVTLLFGGILLRHLQNTEKWHVTVLVVLAAFLAGGNYVSLLPCLILLTLTTAWLIYCKSPKARSVGIVTAIMLAGFFLSAAAPGNQMRQSGMWKIPAWKAVLKSLCQGFIYMTAWTGVWCIILVLLITPLLWQCFKNCSFRFRYPLVVIGLMYGIFCSMSCPTFYTMNSTGPARVVSIVYYGYIIFFFAAYSYLLGYLQRKCDGTLKIKPKMHRAAAGLAAAGILILLMTQTISGNLQMLTTSKAIRLLANGEAKAYADEHRQRMDILQDDTVQDAVLPAYQNRPDMLYVGDFSGDPLDPTNQNAASYFHKKSVVVIYP